MAIKSSHRPQAMLGRLGHDAPHDQHARQRHQRQQEHAHQLPENHAVQNAPIHAVLLSATLCDGSSRGSALRQPMRRLRRCISGSTMPGIGFMVNLRSFSLAVILPRISMVSRFLLTAGGTGRTAGRQQLIEPSPAGVKIEGHVGAVEVELPLPVRLMALPRISSLRMATRLP